MNYSALAAIFTLSVVVLTTPRTQAVADPPANPPVTVFTNATIYTGASEEPLKNASLTVRNGKIEKVMVGEPLMAGATIVDLKGATIIPGLVDTHSHIGIYPKPAVSAHADGNEMTGPVQPGIRAIDSIWPSDPGIQMALAGGVTTANIMPGSGNVIGGQTLYVKLRGNTVEEMRINGKLDDSTEVLGGLKMANGENPKGYGRNKQAAPFTRMKVAALQREQFVKAREYKAKKDAKEKFDVDLGMETLVEVLERKRTVHFHCHRADDLMTAVRIAEEFNFELVLQHATEGYRVANLLAQKKIPVSLTLIDSPGGKAETIGLLEENAAVLNKAGVRVCINTDDFITESRFYLRTGSLALRGGMSEAATLKALTLTPAQVMHLDHRIGSLEPGKDADFVVLSGAPFSVYTKVQQTWIEGKKVFDATDANQKGYRDGGFALPRGTTIPNVAITKSQATVIEMPANIPTTREALKPGLLYILAGRIHTGTGKTIDRGAIVIENGKIKEIGLATDVKRPFGARVIRTLEITPGLIDPGTVAGLSGAWNIPADQDQDEPSDPNQSDLRVLDGFNSTEPLFEFLKANGVTTVHTTPGRVNVIGGTTGVFRSQGLTAEASALNKHFAVWVNLGEAPKEAFKAKGPATRMATAGLVRKAFTDAQTYAAKRKADPAKTPINPKSEGLVAALEGKMPVVFAAHRADDIRTGLRIAEEFKLKPIVALGSESYLLADELAKAKIPVIVHPTMQRPGSSMETLNTLLGTAAILRSKGVPIVIGTSFEGYVPKIRNLRSEAAIAAANGLGQAGALQSITLDAAKLLGIDKDYGSLEVGKVADFVLYDGDPFENATHVTQTYMNGKVVYDRAEYLKLPYERRILPMLSGGNGVGCCLGW